MVKVMRWFLLALGLAAAGWWWLQPPREVPPPAPRPSVGVAPSLAPPPAEEEQRRLARLAEGEDLILQALQVQDPALLGSRNRETLEVARQKLADLSQETGQFGPFYILKYHLGYLDAQLGEAPPVRQRRDFDAFECAGYDYIYSRGARTAAESLRKLQAGRTKEIYYARPGDPTLKLEAMRQLATGLFTGVRSSQRWHLFSSLQLRGLSVVDYCTGTGVALPGLLHAVGPTGNVYAVDVAPSVLEFITDRAKHDPELAMLSKVHLVLASPTDSGLPSDSMDVVFMDGFPIQARSTPVYNAEVKPLVRSLFRILKPGGRLVVWPYFLPDEEMTAILTAAGFTPPQPAPLGGRVKDEHALLFRKPAAVSR